MNINKKKICIILFIILAIYAIINCAYAWQNLNQNAISQIMGKAEPQFSVEFNLKEKNIDLEKTEKTVGGATFYLFDSSGKQIGEQYTTNEEGKINIELECGEYYFEEITPSTGYTFDKTNEEKITKYYFNVENNIGEKINIEAYNIRLVGSLLVRKNVKNKDGTLLNQEQREQESIFYITFSDNGTYTYKIEDGEESNITSGETFTLKHGQTAIFSKIPVGILYNITEETKDGYVIYSTGHRGNITQNGENAVFTSEYSEKEYGSIVITKEVIGNNVESDKEFEFEIIINDKQESFSLKNGQSKTFNNIEDGSKYIVTEKEDTEEKYIHTISEYKGQINEEEKIELPFISTYNVESEEKNGNITITKEIEEDIGNEFDFTIEFYGENAPENSTFKLKANEEKTFENIPYGINYKVYETNSNGYIPIIESVSGTIAGEQTINVKLKNSHKKTDTKISITNILKGQYIETDKQKEFEFILTVNNYDTKFNLKMNETKEFNIPIGALYEIRQNNYYDDGYVQTITNGYGIARKDNIVANITNTYIGDEKILITGEKKWKFIGETKTNIPESITICLKNGDLLVETKIVKPDENNNWTYSFIAPKYDKNGKEIKYTIEEEKIENFTPIYNNYNITNVYVEPIKVNMPDVKNIIEGENASKNKFEFILKAENDAPMPEGSENNRKILNLNGEGTINFGNIEYNTSGVYSYTITEMNGGIKGWEYDNSIYNITITILEKNYKLSYNIDIEKNTEKIGNIIFTNRYKQERLGKNIIINGEKTWEHGDNPIENQPKSIIVKVYADRILKVQKQISELEDWKYSFELPKFAEDGHEILYTIDEEDIPGYSKTIDGYNLNNKYIDDQEIKNENNSEDNNEIDNTTNNENKPIETEKDSKTGTVNYSWIPIIIIIVVILLIFKYIYEKKGKHWKNNKM